MAMVAAAGLTAISSGLGVLSSGNYVKMVGKAGQEARATIKVAGRETRATIEKAEDAAKKTLDKMGREMRSSIELAQAEATTVLRNAGVVAKQSIGEAGVEGRHTTEFARIKAEQVISRAARESELLLIKAGIETQQAITSAGKEVRDTALLCSKEAHDQIKFAGDEAIQVLNEGSRQIKELLDRSTEQIRGLTTGTIQQCQDAIAVSISESEVALGRTVNVINGKVEGLIESIYKQAAALIINMGDQGRLLIRDTGQEISAVADKALGQLFSGQEMIINCAGAESRLTIQAAGKELRSTLYKFPMVAAIAAEALGRNVVFGMKGAINWNSESDRIKNALKDAFVGEKTASIDMIIEHISGQNLKAEDKFSLYKELVTLVNSQGFRDIENCNKSLICIGVAALVDKGLKTTEPGYFGDDEVDYGHTLIECIPGQAREMLLEKGKDALQFFSQIEDLPLIEEPHPLQLELAKKTFEILELKFKLENEKDAFKLEASEKKMIKEKNDDLEKTLNQSGGQVQDFDRLEAELREARERENSLLKYNSFLKETNRKLEDKVKELTDTIGMLQRIS